MKQNEKRRIDGFKFVHPRESPEGKRKWIFDFDSKDVGMIVATVMIVAGLLIVGYQFMQVMEKGKSVVGMATTVTSPAFDNVHVGDKITLMSSDSKPYTLVVSYRTPELVYLKDSVTGRISTKAPDSYGSFIKSATNYEPATPTPVTPTPVTPVQPAVAQPTTDLYSRIVNAESSGVPYAVSTDGAAGVAQMMPATFNEQMPNNKINDQWSTTLTQTATDLRSGTNAWDVNKIKAEYAKTNPGKESEITTANAGSYVLTIAEIRYRTKSGDTMSTLEQLDPRLNPQVSQQASQAYITKLRANVPTLNTGRQIDEEALIAMQYLGPDSAKAFLDQHPEITTTDQLIAELRSTPSYTLGYTGTAVADYIQKVKTGPGATIGVGTHPGTTPSTPTTPAANAEQEKSIKEIQDKLKTLGFTDLTVDTKNIESYKKSLEKAEATPYRTSDIGGKVISIDGKYYTLSPDGTTTLVGKDDNQATLYDSRPLGEGLTINQDIKVVNGEKTGESNNYLSQTSSEGNPISLQLRQDQFDTLSKIDPTKEQVKITPSPEGTTVTVSRGSTELSSFTNSNNLKLDATGKIETGTITTTNYNYYDKYFDKDGNQVSKAEWDKLKPEDRLTPKDNKNNFRSGLTKQENKDGTLYGEGKEEFLTVDKDGTQYRGELTSRVYDQKTTENGVNYNQGDGINYVTDSKGNVMTFNCKFYTGCKFDSVTENGVKVTDIESITDPELKKFAQKQLKDNSQANRRMFFSDVTRSMTQFSGLAGYSSLFMDSETLSAWRESVDSAFASLYLGTDYWASKICASKIDTGSDNLAYVETPDGLIGVAAHIEGEKISIANPLNNTPRYIYKIDYFVQNHESSVVSSGFRSSDKKMKFNVEVRGSGGKKEIYGSDIELATGEVKKISKDQMIVKESLNQYDKVCIVFKTPIRTIGASFTTESKDEICNKFSKYTGGPTEVEVPSSTSGGEEGAAQITADW